MAIADILITRARLLCLHINDLLLLLLHLLIARQLRGIIQTYLAALVHARVDLRLTLRAHGHRLQAIVHSATGVRVHEAARMASTANICCRTGLVLRRLMMAHGTVQLGLDLARFIRSVQMILTATAVLYCGAGAAIVLLVGIDGGRLGATLILSMLTVEICVKFGALA